MDWIARRRRTGPRGLLCFRQFQASPFGKYNRLNSGFLWNDHAPAKVRANGTKVPYWSPLMPHNGKTVFEGALLQRVAFIRQTTDSRGLPIIFFPSIHPQPTLSSLQPPGRVAYTGMCLGKREFATFATHKNNPRTVSTTRDGGKNCDSRK